MPDATPCPWYLIGRAARLEYDKDISGIGNSDRTSAAARPAHDSLPLARMCRRGDGLYSHLRLVTAAALVAFAGVIAVGVPALLPAAVERPPVRRRSAMDGRAAGFGRYRIALGRRKHCRAA